MHKKIAHITDLHLDEEFTLSQNVDARRNWNLILRDVRANGMDELVFGGDIGTPESNGWFFDRIKTHNLGMKVVLGNHDAFTSTTRYSEPSDPERKEFYYSEDEDPFFKWIYLDTSLNAIGPEQLQWLQEALKTPKRIILFIHHPILNTGTTPQREYPLKGSEQIKRALLQVRSEVYVFCGHLHLQDECGEENIKQFTTPAASYQLKTHSQTTEVDSVRFGYRIIEISGSQISTKVMWLNHPEVNVPERW